MSSTKLEVHNILQCGKRRTEPQLKVIRKNCLLGKLKFRCVVPETDTQTDRKTEMLITMLCSPIRVE